MTHRKVLMATCLTALLLLGCAGRPEVSPSMDIHGIEEGLELISGRDPTGRIAWMALRSRSSESSLRLTLSNPSFQGDRLISSHPGGDFRDAAVRAAMTGSPHDPIRLSSGRNQGIVGLYRKDGVTISPPDSRHDAVGISIDQKPRILGPEEQAEWAGDAASGFYVILMDGNPRRPVSIMDAVSAVGWSSDGDILIMMVSRGRDGIGLSYDEAGKLMKSLGADEALAMDGGGSARLTWREGTKLRSYPAGRLYRAVPNRLLLSRLN